MHLYSGVDGSIGISWKGILMDLNFTGISCLAAPTGFAGLPTGSKH